MRHINSTHLMLGNIVYGISLDDDDLEETYLCEVISLKKSVFPFETGYEIYVSVLDDNEPHSFHRFEGIPLNHDRLVRLGFKPIPSLLKLYFNEGLDIYFEDGSYYTNIYFEYNGYFNETKLKFNFVHEVQNYYKGLTGKNLEYSLL